ncbi:P110/LppT family adhesin N-terminal domain [Mesomycoplasma ovipneumoniae]|uniref:P110/LppT family adhesin N-terminal domain n=2 Tax=Mesomycoplasma ovipneumoniae TaxID=29562 RepID=UPI002964CD98|nr:P110/LppT family adhesin N-terminal domain [Mesomycoplasma ovipneumoniae]MDW2910947.1 P110/LppT family adhesin N-terminal domain [Mesomycoplasma ovipneumoniae]MDW2917844.1 P110/LppT family adhesin N-terminal domain [Mesomycoplasma ovipneumoniae]MDW2920801.1 P110/LppT family adhesin N-terminal domain [Mesomycoplasma ovipneumoniae]MDW2927285.1 P110/LppT family adhesin N-terminal domain [Mesomycoplasma ovipneumoniae]MDW2929073.1 P110/LppT family adhesin N-terminal domain [Mesomycoplasma ovipne
MKKLKLNHIIFAIIGVSAVVSISASVPYLISLQSKNYNSKLSEFDDKLANATNLNVNSEFNTSEFDSLVANLKLKSKFAKKLSASDALNLHFDKAYNFDLNNAIDFSQISQKYPDLNFRLVIPRSQSEVKIESNKIKNLAVNISNSSKSINYTASFDLDFSDQDKTLNFSAQNLSASISLLNQDFLEGKTATEIAILFYNEFKENFEKTKNSSSALFATFSKFGGISFSINSEPVFVFPSNFEIKPELQQEKLMFTNIDDVNNKIDLALDLFDKKTQKSSKLTLNFVDVPKKTDQKKSSELLKIFKKNYKFNSEISKHLAQNKLSVSEYFAQNPQNLDLEQFNSWFTLSSTENENKTFLEEIKNLIPNFDPKSLSFSVKENKNNPKNSNIVNVGLNLEGNFSDQLLLPSGLNLGEDNTYTFNFELEFDANEEIYGAYFKNAIESFDQQGSKDIDNLSFEIKKDLPITVFASTIDDKIQPFLNKPYDIKNITTQLTPFFEALNFFATKSNKINKTPIVSSTEKPADQPADQPTEPSDASTTSVDENVSALPTLFQETAESGSGSSPSPSPGSSTSSSPSEESTPTPPTPTPTPDTTTPSPVQQSLLGDYLKKLLEGLEKSDLPEGTSIYFSRDFQDETYEINLKIKTPNGVERNLTVELDNVNEENKLYKSFSDNVKTHLFLDWKTNVETEEQSLDGQKQQVVKSISAVNNPNFRFKANPAPSEKFKGKVHVDEQEQGIYLAEGGISLEKDSNNNTDLKLKDGTSLLYAFKPKKLPEIDFLQYFLIKTGEEENDFNLVIEKELFVQGIFKIGAEFIPKPKPKSRPNHISFDINKAGFQRTYNGEFKFEPKFEKGENKSTLEIIPKNPLSSLQDFLNNSESTIILGVDVQKKDDKSVMKMKFYSSESDDAKKPIFTWELEIPKEAKLNFKKGFTFGTTKSENQKGIDNKGPRSETGITFKGFVLFDTPQSEEGYNKLFEKFRSEYL